MAQGVVFKQWYKSINLPGVAVRNQKHLNYIATRKGSIPNPGCSFGLWGRLHHRMPSKIDSLEYAKKEVGIASGKHTLYRAIISVDKDTAQKYDLYERSSWERLVNERINTIAKETEIEQKDFCWLASMHHSKTHPHVHIIYWDDSGKVRNEHVPEERFEILAERVRASFNRGIFQEEISQLQTAQKEVISTARLELMAMCREVNLSEALDLSRISKARLDELTTDFANLVLAIPRKGSLRYQTLSANFKDQLNAFIGKIMTIRDYASLESKYIKLTDEISDLYGNGDATKQHNRDAAHKKLYTDLGNGILNVMRDYLEELRSDTPTDQETMAAVVRSNTEALIQSSADYSLLLQKMPTLRTPMNEVWKDKEFSKLHKKVVNGVAGDFRIRTQVQGYTNALIRELPPTRPANKDDTVEFINRPGTATVTDIRDNGSLILKVELKDGKSYQSTAKQADVRVLPETGEGETIAELRRRMERDTYRIVREILNEHIKTDSGYQAQMQTQTVLSMLLRLFTDLSQGANQLKSQRDLVKSRSKDMSKTAKRDRRKQLEQSSDWEFEL